MILLSCIQLSDSLNFSVQALHRLIWDSNVLFIREFLLLMVTWDILSLCPDEEWEGVSSYRYCWYIFKFITIGVEYNIVSCVDNLALALLFYFEMKIYLFDHRRGVNRGLCFVWCIGKKVLLSWAQVCAFEYWVWDQKMGLDVVLDEFVLCGRVFKFHAGHVLGWYELWGTLIVTWISPFGA